MRQSKSVLSLTKGGDENAANHQHGKIKRSKDARGEFMKQHPCLSPGKTSGACPRYVVDHVNRNGILG
jgi:hypothetical protein